MAKAYSISPRVLPGSAIFVATFYNSDGARVTRSLGVAARDRAGQICAGLVILHNRKVKTEDEALLLDVDPACIALFFARAGERRKAAIAAPSEDVAASVARLRRKFQGAAPVVDAPEIDAEKLRSKRAENVFRTKLGEEYQKRLADQQALANLERSVLGKAAQATKNAPGLETARAAFEAHLERTVKKPVDYTKPLDDFLKHLSTHAPAVANIAAVEPGHLLSFLDTAAVPNPNKKSIRRHNLRKLVGRFFNWAAQRYGIVSPMSGVKAVPAKALRRERGEIHWHSLNEVERALKAIPARLKAAGHADESGTVPEADIAYWRALVSMLGFAGLQLAELCWLRIEDVQWRSARMRATVWITTVDDPLDDTQRHLLKTDNRVRHVDLHPRHLLPLIREHVDAGRSGSHFLFPMQTDRKRRGLKENDERWREQTLSTVLRGHVGGKDRKRRKPTPGLLPKGMNAKSLRRTFGSLLIRSGKTTEQVAAAMGNTPEIVREHYARIMGCEVDVDF